MNNVPVPGRRNRSFPADNEAAGLESIFPRNRTGGATFFHARRASASNPRTPTRNKANPFSGRPIGPPDRGDAFKLSLRSAIRRQLRGRTRGRANFPDKKRELIAGSGAPLNFVGFSHFPVSTGTFPRADSRYEGLAERRPWSRVSKAR